MLVFYHSFLFMKIEKLFYKNILDMQETFASDLFEKVYYPWEVLPKIKEFILVAGKKLPKSEYEEIKENVWVSVDSKVAPSAHIDGPTIIQKNSDIRHCAFIRGSAIVGENCVVGNSTELKNSVLFNGVQIPHFNYVGDSILGHKAHLGAGAITSNVRSDRLDVRLNFEGKKIDTHLRKFGAIIGDGVEIGCNAVLNPGTVLGRNTIVYPTSMVRGCVENDSIFKNDGKIIKKF